MKSAISLLFILFSLTRLVISSPLFLSLQCCCGCTDDVCPIVGHQCPDPRNECTGITSEITCNALQKTRNASDPHKSARTPIEVLRVEGPTTNHKNANSVLPLVVADGATMKVTAIKESGESGHKNFGERVINEKAYKELGVTISPVIPDIAIEELTKENRTKREAMVQVNPSVPLAELSEQDVLKNGNEVVDNEIDGNESMKRQSMIKSYAELLSELEQMKQYVRRVFGANSSPLENLTQDVRKSAQLLSNGKLFVYNDEETKELGNVITKLRENYGEMMMESRRAEEALGEIMEQQLSFNPKSRSTDLSDNMITLIGDVTREHSERRRGKRAADKNEKSSEKSGSGSGGGNCNDIKLKKIIKDNIKEDAKSSKRAIQKAAEEEFGGTFNVVCSPCEFSFVVSSQKYCEGFKGEVACFAFLQPPTKLKLRRLLL